MISPIIAMRQKNTCSTLYLCVKSNGEVLLDNIIHKMIIQHIPNPHPPNYSHHHEILQCCCCLMMENILEKSTHHGRHHKSISKYKSLALCHSIQCSLCNLLAAADHCNGKFTKANLVDTTDIPIFE